MDIQDLIQITDLLGGLFFACFYGIRLYMLLKQCSDKQKK